MQSLIFDTSDHILPTTPAVNLIIDSIPHIVWTASPDGLTTYVNGFCAEYTGLPREANYEGNWLELVHPDDRVRAERAWLHAVGAQTEFMLQYRLHRSDGVFRWHVVRALPLRKADGVIHMWIGTATDIEDEKRLELSLRRSEREAVEALKLLEGIGAAAPIGFKLVDRNLRIVRLNDRLAQVNGKPVEDQIGRTVAEVAPHLWPQLEAIYHRALNGFATINVDLAAPSALDPQRTAHWLASFYPVRVGGEIIGVGNVVIDITDRVEADEFRAVVMENMAEGLYALDTNGAVTYVNPAASRMLGWTEDELRGKLMHNTIHFQRADGTPVAADACDLLEVRTQGRTVRNDDDAFTRKNGSIFPVAYSSAPLRSGKTVNGVVVVFRDITEEIDKHAAVQRDLAELSWIGRIRDAIDEHRLVLYSQPIVPLTDGDASEELLLRMVGRDGEIVAPGSFLPVAEKFGLIVEIDRWVISQAAKLAAQSGRVIEVNVSAESIGARDLIGFIGRQLADTGADPAHLIFEITETALMHDLTRGEMFARALAEFGCGLALDDFGTGFGSFTYLKKLPLTHLKIDTEFVRDLDENPANRHVVRAIVSLARAFGLRTIAEGVEDEETLTHLRMEGVDFAQGFHIGRPKPTAAIE
jgi:PAS domain S-box-containing protein